MVQAWLKKKGLASADKKAGRVAAEGLIASYIHAGSSLGVLIEVNSETDFVAKGDVMQELAADMAMQVRVPACLHRRLVVGPVGHMQRSCKHGLMHLGHVHDVLICCKGALCVSGPGAVPFSSRLPLTPQHTFCACPGCGKSGGAVCVCGRHPPGRQGL